MSSPTDPGTPRQPKVTVCVITYNQERYIRTCLESLVTQDTDFDFEVIVGDDCSTDGTRAVVQEFVDRYPRRVRPLFQPRNTGGSRNNLAIHAAARGEYVAHLDGDDYALPGKLQAQADALDQDPACVAVWHRVDFFDNDGGFCSGSTADLSSFRDGKVGFADAVRLGFVGVFSSLMYRRSARSPVDESRQILDLYFTLDLLSKGHGRILDRVLGRYYVASPGSLTATARQRGHLVAIEHAREFLHRRPENRRDFLIWALCCALIEAKNRRWRSGWAFVKLGWRARLPVGWSALRSNLQRMRKTQVQWRNRRKLIA
jgi:glycosyltransferase involved in cell wall biosynthesis